MKNRFPRQSNAFLIPSSTHPRPSVVPISDVIQMTPPPPPAPVPYRKPPQLLNNCESASSVIHNLTSGGVGGSGAPIIVPTSTSGPMAPTTEIQAALKDIRSTIQRTKNLQQDLLDQNDEYLHSTEINDSPLNMKSSAVWMPRWERRRMDKKSEVIKLGNIFNTFFSRFSVSVNVERTLRRAPSRMCCTS